MKTSDDFRNQAIKYNITKWTIRNCSICNFPIGYYFFRYPEYEVVFDGGCGCTSLSNLRPATWQDVADYYNKQTNLEYIKELNLFWKFNSDREYTSGDIRKRFETWKKEQCI